MSFGDTGIVMARVIGVLAETMTPEQRRQAAEKLRALDGDDIERRFIDTTATALDTFADEDE